jgi:hypothetical protein
MSWSGMIFQDGLHGLQGRVSRDLPKLPSTTSRIRSRHDSWVSKWFELSKPTVIRTLQQALEVEARIARRHLRRRRRDVVLRLAVLLDDVVVQEAVAVHVDHEVSIRVLLTERLVLQERTIVADRLLTVPELSARLGLNF